MIIILLKSSFILKLAVTGDVNPMKDFKAVIFCLYGILIDTEKICLNSFKEVLKEYNYGIIEKFYLTMIDRNLNGIKEVIMKDYWIKGINVSDVKVHDDNMKKIPYKIFNDLSEVKTYFEIFNVVLLRVINRISIC